MKEKILEALKNKYSNLGLSKDVLDGFAEFLSLSITEESGIEEGVAKIEGILKTQQKEYDKIRAAAAKKKDEEVKKEEKKTDEPTPKQDEKKDPAPKKDAEMPEWAKTLMGEVTGLKQKISERDKAAIIETRRKQVTAIVSKLPQSVQKAYERMNLDLSDEDFEALKTSITEEVGTMEKDIAAKSSLSKPPFVGGNDVPKTDLSKEDAEAIAKNILH